MKRAGITYLLFIILILAGCSHQSVGHLDKRPWVTDTPQTIAMKFWRFEFHNMPLKEGVGLQGIAYPNSELFPEWAKWYDQLSFTAYLSEQSGNVITSAQLDILPRELGNDRSIPFEFRLTPEHGNDPLYVSFGYRMVLSEKAWQPGAAQEGRIHMAHEGALTQ